jgi:uncharacterized repeat protein (TIGR01451 family)
VLLAAACFVTGISGPTNVDPGQTVTYDIPFETNSSGTNGTAYVWFDVPSDWTFNNATYDATVNGSNVSGSPATGVGTSGSPCVALPGPAAGYQRLGFSATFPTVTASDSGVLHVTLTVGGASGPYTLAATGGGSFGGPQSQCNSTETLDVEVSSPAPTAPVVEKFFTPATIAPGGTSRLTIRLQNDNAAPITDVAFTDSYPAGLVNSATPNLTTTCVGSAGSAPSSVSLSDATIPANGNCTVSIDVTAAAEGVYVNDIPAGAVTSSVGLPNESTTGTLNVTAAAVASPTVPTMGEWGLMLLAIGLGVIAIKMLR